jgi:alpha-ketoglutarate-dependent taurine dioxygenase
MSTVAASTQCWTVSPITGTFGATLSGSLLTEPTAAEEVADLLATHLVLAIRGQHLTPAQQVAFARRLGHPTPAHPVVPGLEGFPEILVLDGAAGGRNARWHTDVTFMARPPAASILVAETVPEFGGDTLWADMRTAYTALSQPMRTLVDGLVAVHRITPLAYWGEPFDTALTRNDAAALLDAANAVPPVAHPVVRIHPRTGRPSLFVNPGFTSHIIGMSRHESDGLLRLLFEHVTQPELMMRHRWQPGDVVIWDNQATMHYASNDYGADDRTMRRVTLAGAEPIGPSGFTSHVLDDPLLAIR